MPYPFHDKRIMRRVALKSWSIRPYLLLCREDRPHRVHQVREVSNGIRYIARSGWPWGLSWQAHPPVGT